MSDTAVPPATDATSLKRFFKRQFDIPVRVSTGTGKTCWICVRIPCEHKPYKAQEPIVYRHRFPDELGDRCAEIVYPGRGWRWCGNLAAHMISMTRAQWEQLLRQYADQPTEPASA